MCETVVVKRIILQKACNSEILSVYEDCTAGFRNMSGIPDSKHTAAVTVYCGKITV